MVHADIWSNVVDWVSAAPFEIEILVMGVQIDMRDMTSD